MRTTARAVGWHPRYDLLPKIFFKTPKYFVRSNNFSFVSCMKALFVGSRSSTVNQVISLSIARKSSKRFKLGAKNLIFSKFRSEKDNNKVDCTIKTL